MVADFNHLFPLSMWCFFSKDEVITGTVCTTFSLSPEGLCEVSEEESRAVYVT